MASTDTRMRPGGFSLLLLTGASLILAGTAMLVTAADPKAREATLFGGATPVVVGGAMVIVLVASVATFVGRGRPAAGGGLIVVAAVFAAIGIGLLTHGPSVVTTGVFLLPTVITTLALAWMALSTNRGKVIR